jgi:predicted dehydrogenase
MPDLNVALVGCGALGDVHLTCWMNMIGVRVRAVIDTDAAIAARTAGQYAGVAAFAKLSDALSQGAFDIADICLPPAQQADAVEQALRAGANVLCEKPLGESSERARRLIALANDRERLLMTGFVHRFHPPILFLRELIENDDIGRPTLFRCRFSGLWSEAEAQRAGDILSETATHGIDLFRWLCGEVVSVQSRVKRVSLGIAVPDTAALLLESDRGAIGVVEASWSAPGGHNRIEIYGTAGACIYDYESEALRYLTPDSPVWQNRHETGPNRYERLLSHCADAARGLQSPVLSGNDGLRALEICEEARSQNAF